MRVVHGGQDFSYQQPIVPGMTLINRAVAVGVHGASSGVVVLGKGITETKSGDPVLEPYTAAFFRGAKLDIDEGEALTEHASNRVWLTSAIRAIRSAVNGTRRTISRSGGLVVICNAVGAEEGCLPSRGDPSPSSKVGSPERRSAPMALGRRRTWIATSGRAWPLKATR
ncbi:MAG: hypothetical protein ACYC91_09350 [Solirubrobacteraceae bacterium]